MLRFYQIILTVISLVLQARVYSQMGLKIGDNCPDIKLTNIYNSNVSECKLSDFEGKLIIIYFWSTYCTACIKSFPKLDSLQNKFASKIKILVVNDQKDGDKVIPKFWKTNKITRRLSLPVVIDESRKLKEIFPRNGVPHVIWIDENRVVKGITTDQYLKEENIVALLNRVTVNWPINYYNNSFNYQKLLVSFNDSSVEKPANIYHNAITGYIKNVQPKSDFQIDTATGTARYFAINIPIIELYQQAVQNQNKRFANMNRLILEVKDSTKYFYNKDENYYEEWMSKNSYCYESTFSISKERESFFDDMRKDLNRYFRLNGRIEKRKVKCLVLIKTGSVDEKSGAKHAVISGIQNKRYYCLNSVDQLIETLEYSNGCPPVIDETNLIGQVSIYVPSDVSNLNDAKSILKLQGLDLVVNERSIDMLVISEPPSSNFMTKSK